MKRVVPNSKIYPRSTHKLKYLVFICVLLIQNVTWSKDYFIKRGNNFAEGTLNLRRWFSGTKLEFKAAFNETNIYTAPKGGKRDSNKLYGFSDCGRLADDSSARFGWRWYNNRLEITAVTHRGGEWFVHEIVGVAELNQVYDFKIELSEDKAHYIYTFNNEPPVVIERDCRDESMFGYTLYPYFGGSEQSPKDMTLSVWTQPRANFVLTKAGPNPLRSGEIINLYLLVGEPMEIEFEIFNILGQLVHKTEEIFFYESQIPQKHQLKLPGHLSTGLYLVRPMSKSDNKTQPGYVTGMGGDSLKLLYSR